MHRLTLALALLALLAWGCTERIDDQQDSGPVVCASLEEAGYTLVPMGGVGIDALMTGRRRSDADGYDVGSPFGVRLGSAGGVRLVSSTTSLLWMVALELDGTLSTVAWDRMPGTGAWGDDSYAVGTSRSAGRLGEQLRVRWFDGPEALIEEIELYRHVPACDSYGRSSVQVAAGGAALWFFGECGAATDGWQAHSFGRDGAPTLTPAGVRLGRVHAETPGAARFVGTSDGGFWYVTELGDAGSGTVHAVRIAADGSVIASTPPLETEANLGREEGEPSYPIRVRGLFAEVTRDDGLVLHFAGRTRAPPDTSPPTSRFFGIGADGSIAWRQVSPPGLLAAGGMFLDEPRMAEHQGGMVALLASAGAGPPEYRLLRVAADGETPLGEEGVLLPWLPTTSTRYSATTPVSVALDVDTSGNVFVGMETRFGALVQRYDLAGAPAWEVPISTTNVYLSDDWGYALRLVADQRGGVWIVDYGANHRSGVQHLDADAHQLFWSRIYRCRPDLEFPNQSEAYPYRVRPALHDEPYWPGHPYEGVDGFPPAP